MSNQEKANKITKIINLSVGCVVAVLHEERDKITDEEYGFLLKYKSDIYSILDKLKIKDIDEISDIMGFEKTIGKKIDKLLRLKAQCIIPIRYIFSHYT